MKFDEFFFNNIVFKFEKVFLDIISIEKFFHNNDYVKDFNNDFELIDNSLINVLFVVANFDSKLYFSFISTKSQLVSSKTQKKKARKSKINKYQFLLNFSNIYLDFCFANITREFAIVMNMNVLFDEMKHIYATIILLI